MNSDEIHYRSASGDDVPGICHVLEPFVMANLLLRRTPEELQQLTQYGFVAECNGEIVGFSAVEIYSRKLAEVQCLAVDSRFHRRGMGRELVNLCVQLTRDKQVLELMAITSSEEFLRDCGFDYSLPNQKRALFVKTHDEDETTHT